jgi:hypothetical protein
MPTFGNYYRDWNEQVKVRIADVGLTAAMLASPNSPVTWLTTLGFAKATMIVETRRKVT